MTAPFLTLGPIATAASGVDLTIAVAVAAGLISFLSPCVLPMVPGYLSLVTGLSVGEM